MNRRGFIKGVAAIGVAAAAPLQAEPLAQDGVVTLTAGKHGPDKGWIHYAVSQANGMRRYFMDGIEVEPSQWHNLDALDRWQLTEMEVNLPARSAPGATTVERWDHPDEIYADEVVRRW